MTALVPWSLGQEGWGYVFRNPDGKIEVEIHRAGPELNPIGQLLEMAAKHRGDYEEISDGLEAGIRVKPDGGFTLTARLRPWEYARLVDEVLLADERFRFAGTRWEFQ